MLGPHAASVRSSSMAIISATTVIAHRRNDEKGPSLPRPTLARTPSSIRAGFLKARERDHGRQKVPRRLRLFFVADTFLKSLDCLAPLGVGGIVRPVFRRCRAAYLACCPKRFALCHPSDPNTMPPKRESLVVDWTEELFASCCPAPLKIAVTNPIHWRIRRPADPRAQDHWESTCCWAESTRGRCVLFLLPCSGLQSRASGGELAVLVGGPVVGFTRLAARRRRRHHR